MYVEEKKALLDKCMFSEIWLDSIDEQSIEKLIFLNVELYVKKIWKRIIMQPHVMGMSLRICMILRPIRWIYVQMVFILQMY